MILAVKTALVRRKKSKVFKKHFFFKLGKLIAIKKEKKRYFDFEELLIKTINKNVKRIQLGKWLNILEIQKHY